MRSERRRIQLDADEAELVARVQSLRRELAAKQLEKLFTRHASETERCESERGTVGTQ